MEKILQIIGAKEVEGKMVKICCIPYTSKEVRKKHKGFLEMASSGLDIKSMVKEINEHKQQITIFYVTRDVWRKELKNRLYSTIKINISLEKFIPSDE